MILIHAAEMSSLLRELFSRLHFKSPPLLAFASAVLCRLKLLPSQVPFSQVCEIRSGCLLLSLGLVSIFRHGILSLIAFVTIAAIIAFITLRKVGLAKDVGKEE